MSTTCRGASASIRAVRSRNARLRSLAKRPYCAGSHRIRSAYLRRAFTGSSQPAPSPAIRSSGRVKTMPALVDRPMAAPAEAPPAPARWPRPALAGLLATTALLYLWNLSASGYGNTFYAAAAQAGSQSWSAWFFGSLDAQNFITVDKPPASLWVTGLSVRLFGMSSWSVMAPQALMGVAAVAVVD